MHWADVTAQALAHKGPKHIISTGITPSGEFHIGHLREILTGDMISRAAKNAGLDVDFIFIVDDADPLRKVYPFLHEEYSKFIGHQIGSIPAPDKEGKPDINSFENGGISYADYFLNPFLEALGKIGVKPRIIKNLNSYQSGKFNDVSKIACDKAEEIKEIIERVSGRELPEKWFPWSPLDSKGSLEGVEVTGYDFPLVYWKDSHGVEGESDITKGEGKLPWRIDWPAKWAWIGVTCEAFGKDHGAAGGSYSTGREISQLFGHAPPQPLTYEWISLKGKGAMSSSSGNTIGPMEALELVPPEILRLLIAQSKPNKAIEFDTGMSLVNLADEYERLISRNFQEELSADDLSRRKRVQIEDAIGALNMSKISIDDSFETSNVSFRHLSLLAQTKSSDELIWESLGYNENNNPSKSLIDRLERMKLWIKSKHLPEEMRISIIDNPQSETFAEFSADELKILSTMKKELTNCQWNVDDIGNAIPNSAKSHNLSPRIAYRVAYLTFMGRERGPRLAPILVELEQSRVVKIIENCLSITDS
ncbi:MAG: lysine--tRNA ligase [Euryarchaeota archaeon]|nr:lysine--tRNA ligase [Euryarchaeota archaeon]|tara:strand:- start:12694 stop:14298 length:1605 start_codon:yes stop_codon:yes gene_type:complete